MERCLQLARLGAGMVAPNPMVGAVLVHDNRIIGEGYHSQYGEAHAEVNCFNSVLPENVHLIPDATLYVSLEPCAHFGKTPPCADLCIEKKVSKVVIGCRDPFELVDGRGIEKLTGAGIKVEYGILEMECSELNKRFFTFHEEKRPFIILKWAQSSDGFISGTTSQRILISNEFTNRIVHKWRTEEAAIAIGTNTALKDDPALSTRLWPGKNPVRLIVDLELRLPSSFRVFDGTIPTVIFNTLKHDLPFEKIVPSDLKGLNYYQVTNDVSIIHQMINALYRMNIHSVLVEGGATLLQSFINENIWDEARVITNHEMLIGEGLRGPVLQHARLIESQKVFTDIIQTFRNVAS